MIHLSGTSWERKCQNAELNSAMNEWNVTNLAR